MRNYQIDIARTIAIASVVFAHSAGFGVGRFGVQLFFVISGFLLANFSSNETRMQFIIHRAFRLFPLYFTFVFIYSKLDNHNYFTPSNLLLLGNISWIDLQIPGGWSVSSEWIFSILLICLAIHKKRHLLIVLAVSIILQIATAMAVLFAGGVHTSLTSKEYSFLTWINTTNPYINLSFFLIGIAIRLQYISLNWNSSYLISCIFLSVVFDLLIGHFIFLWNFSIFAIFSLCFRLKFRTRLRNIFSFIGKRTYGIFFSHFIVMRQLSHVDLFGIPSLTNRMLFFLLTFVLSVFIGSLTWYLIESPSLAVYRSLFRDGI